MCKELYYNYIKIQKSLSPKFAVHNLYSIHSSAWEKMAAITCSRVSSRVTMWRGLFRPEVDVRCAAGIARRRMSTREAPVFRKLNVEFSDVRVQDLLRKLAGMDLNKVFRRRREELEVPKYQLMTDEQLMQVAIVAQGSNCGLVRACLRM